MIVWDRDDTATAVGIGLCFLAFIATVIYAARYEARAVAAAPTEVKLPDPWGQVDREISVRAVDVGGLECAVLVQRNMGDRRVDLWCRAR